jgi:hypothetical protein
VTPVKATQPIDVVAAHSDNKALLAGIDAALKTFLADGTYTNLILARVL